MESIVFNKYFIKIKKKMPVIMIVLILTTLYSLTYSVITSSNVDKLREALRVSKIEIEESENSKKYMETIIDTVNEITNTNESLESSISKFKDTIKDLQNSLMEKEYENEKLKDDLKDKDNKIKEMSRITTFDENNIGSISNATISHLKRALKGTALEDLAEYFIEAEREYNVNAYFLVGLVANESSWGTSQRAVEQNNLTGHAVYTPYSRGTVFSSKEESILKTASDIRNNYLNEDGPYYNGTSLRAINIKYSQINGQPNPDWYNVISNIANDCNKKANNN